MLCKIYFGFILSVQVIDGFWNGKISIGIEVIDIIYLLKYNNVTRIRCINVIISMTLSLHCLYIDSQMYTFPINI